MELGTGIFLSALFIGTVLLYNSTKDRWNWKKGIKYIVISATGLVLVVSGVFYFGSVYEDLPKAQNELLNIKLGMTQDDVLFTKGSPTEKSPHKTESTHFENWVYKAKGKSADSFRVDFKNEKVVRVIHVSSGEYQNMGVGGISQWNDQETILEKYGEPDRISVSADKKSRAYNYDEYHVAYGLHLNEVNVVAIYDPNETKGLIFKTNNDNHKQDKE